MKKLTKWLVSIAVILGLSMVSGLAVSAAKDKVPDDARSVSNPVDADDDVLKGAEKIYKKSCKKCHGSSGDGKGPGAKGMDPLPPDWTAGVSLTDGELHWIIMNGSDGTEMKGWKEGLAKAGKEVSDDEAWGLVHFIRSLAP